jgi:palmitoyltransferase
MLIQLQFADCSLSSATFFGLFTAGMTGTSLELAANNLTQVEKLGGKTKVHILAVLKPSPEKLRRTTPLFAPEVSYREITYPLGARFESNNHTSKSVPVTTANQNIPTRQGLENAQNAQSSNEPADPSPAQPPQNPSAAGAAEPSTQSSIRPPEGAQDIAPLAEVVAQDPIISTQENQTPVPSEPLTESSTELPVQDTISSAGTAARQPTTPIRGNERPTETLSARDLQATRTFAILKMLRPGDNPWELGSARLNLETVMGRSIVDWLLPIRRSPCCNHENAESQFRVGPKVDFLRASCYFIDPDDIHLPKGSRKELERLANERKLNQPARDPLLNGSNTIPMRALPHDFHPPQG